MKNKILVTGGTGFIGSHFIDLSLSKNYYDIDIIFSENNASQQDKENLNKFKDQCNIIEADISNKDELEKKVVNKEYDFIINFAAISRPIYADYMKYLKINSMGTLNVCGIAKKCIFLKKIIHISTVSVLGQSENGIPLDENNFNDIKDDYGISKKISEEIFLTYCRDNKIPYTVYRPCLTYGPGCMPRLLMFKFINIGIFPLFNKGETRIEFLYVKNFTELLYENLNLNKDLNEIFNVTDGNSYEIAEIVKTISSSLSKKRGFIPLNKNIGRILGYTAYIIFKLLRKKEPFSHNTVKWMTSDVNVYSSEKAKTKLNYVRRYSLVEGIKETVNWYKKNNHL